MKKRLLSLVVLALSLAACGQTVAPVTPPPTQPPVPTVPVMFWHGDPGEDWPQSFEEAVPRAELVVLADVVSVKQGPDWVGNPEVNDRHPTQRITLHVVKAYKGTVGQGEDLVLFQGGNGLYQGHISVQEQVLMVNENDPLYQAGERYLLALQPLDALVPEEVRQWQPQPWQAGMVQTLWSGRLLVNQDGTVTGVVADAAGRAAPRDTLGKTLEEFEARIAAARTATPTAAAVTPTAIAATPTVIREESPAVKWVLKATLPEEPVTAGVFRLPAPDKPTVAEVRQLATQFGLPGEIYIQEPLTDYHLFGVTQTLSVSDVPGGAQTQIYYRPVSDEDYDPANLLPFDQAAPIATAFLTERGLLDFPYQVVPVPYYVVPVQYYSDYYYSAKLPKAAHRSSLLLRWER